MESSIPEAGAHSSIITLEEEAHCHKARIFSLLTKVPVVRAWKGAICDGAVYCGMGTFPLSLSYADRYFQASKVDISYLTFSIVTIYKEAGIDRFQGHLSPAQCEASEFLIVTFFNDHDKVAVLPHKFYWPPVNEESIGKDQGPIFDFSVMSMDPYCIHIDLLLAQIEDLSKMTRVPAFDTTTPFEIALEGRIPMGSTPETIMPQASEPQVSDQVEEEGLRAIHKIFETSQNVKVDFLEYQPLLRDFKMVISPCDEFPHGLEAVISHIIPGSDPLRQTTHSNDDLQYADYLLTQGLKTSQKYYYFVPRRIIHKDWFLDLRLEKSMHKHLYDSGRQLKIKEFFLDANLAEEFGKDVWNIIRKYPPSPGPNPTPAEEKQAKWKKAVPWLKAVTQTGPKQKAPEDRAEPVSDPNPTPAEEKQEVWKKVVPLLETAMQANLKQKAPKVEEKAVVRNDSGTGDDGAVKPSDTSLLVDHYVEKLSLDDKKGENGAT